MNALVWYIFGRNPELHLWFQEILSVLYFPLLLAMTDDDFG